MRGFDDWQRQRSVSMGRHRRGTLAVLVLNFFMGAFNIVLMLGAGLGGSWVGVGISLFLGGALGFALSYTGAKTHNSWFWLYGLLYVALPLAFGLSVDRTEQRAATQIAWVGAMALVYLISLAGGLAGKKRFS
ncbi:hypothetical protein [Ottowia testudinis]|uniref:Uncharacterized protein n=1 Tax=Ottowia testudinis TaxID=2816950 RepID=A0A975CIB9_9BURK|nr:hypothetical protein [Ottowia testudinis]QTD46720.1 hypothetical protein J1M35_07570 [Ottowia testudinis]